MGIRVLHYTSTKHASMNRCAADCRSEWERLAGQYKRADNSYN